MRACVWLAAAVPLALLALAAARRADQDFEFDEAPEAATARPRRPRRYIYDPQSALCRALVCRKREACLLRDAYTALCASKKDVLRRGDIIVPATAADEEEAAAEGAQWERGDDEDVFYEARQDARAPHPPPAPPQQQQHPAADRCVGCGGAARAQFLCGSDNRTYSSLCRLDLHNCVRRARPPVRLACRGFCPCAPAALATAPARARPDERRRRRPAGPASDAAGGAPAERWRRRYELGHAGCQLDKMANRLLDWFSVLMEEAGGTAPPEDGFGRGCKPEVRWMFAHLDAAGDGVLSAADLYALRHDERERCLRPFLASCGSSGGGGGGVTRGAWCACLRGAARPCAALRRAVAARAGGEGGAYVPACDARGYYRPRQCHAALAVCWCVDPHGVERPGTRTKGAPACPGDEEVESNALNDTVEADEEEEAEAAAGAAGAGVAGDDDEDAAGGSGDRELRF